MEIQHYLMAILGGLMVGSVAGWVLMANGRVAGVSGMTSSSLRPRSADAAWQVIFLLGLVAGGMLLTWLDPAGLPIATVVPVELMVGAGLLVGFAVRFDEGREILRVGRVIRSRSSQFGHEIAAS